MDLSILSRLVRGKVLLGEELAPHTSIGVGGKADALVVPDGIDDVREVLRFCRSEDLPLLFLGRGTNILILDDGFPGVVVKVGGKMSEVKLSAPHTVEAEAGVALSDVIELSKRLRLSGMEFAIGIPGSIGGGVWINAGAKTHSLGDVVSFVDVLDEEGGLVRLERDELSFGYRTSSFQDKDWFIWRVGLVLQPSSSEVIEEKLRYFWERRKHQPYHFPSAGCVFKNPPGAFAGRLIEMSGCKGMRIGDAMVSPNHANFIVNLGNARASDVLALIRVVRDRVRESFGVELELEIEVRGGELETVRRRCAREMVLERNWR